ncbi:hypothetical protein [Microbulbifer sp. JSM ZJ756]|uniref:hypothetical protein n=1 Tax=Microbulbifer sp. JSM ZJ756 TaxID=3376191 RepID=UPI0037B1B0CE
MSSEVLTVRELKDMLEGLKDSDKIHLPGELTFYRLKPWGDDEFIIEVNEPQAYVSDEFKRKNPQLKVAFISTDNVEWDEAGFLGGPVNVELS